VVLPFPLNAGGSFFGNSVTPEASFDSNVEGGYPVAGELPFNQSLGVLRSLAALGLLIGGLTSRDHPCEPENASRYRGKGEAPPLHQFKMH